MFVFHPLTRPGGRTPDPATILVSKNCPFGYHRSKFNVNTHVVLLPPKQGAFGRNDAIGIL